MGAQQWYGSFGRRVAIALVVLGVTVAIPVGTGNAGAQTVARPEGAGPPPAGTGMGTKKAMSRSDCNADRGPYGRLNGVYQGSGPVCVVAWKKGADNGGATAQGVTKDKIRVVVVTPNPTQLAAQVAGVPQNRQTGKPGLMSDAFTDNLAAVKGFYETYGRDIDLQYVESTGNDEAAQRADALKVEELKPFAVIDSLSTGLDTLETVIAADKILVTGYAATTEKALKQAPYRWGQSDSQAVAYNVSEMVGKQLVGKKAAWAGDDSLKSKPRVFAMIYATGVIDPKQFDTALAKYKGKTAENFAYKGNGSPLGDKEQAQQDAPPMIVKMKSEGVTSVILFTDIGMTSVLLEQANKQDFHPEWIMTGNQFQDAVFLDRNSYDQSQWAHAFGTSGFAPTYQDGVKTVDPVAWYWGASQGTYNSVVDSWLQWLLGGIHTAGPKLTAKTFQQGLFATPAPQNDAQIGSYYGKNARLPYDEYMAGTVTFAPSWYDSATEGPDNIYGDRIGKGVLWYLNDGARYHSGGWPTKPLGFFSKNGAVVSKPTRPVPLVLSPCTNCPSNGGPGVPSNRGA